MTRAARHAFCFVAVAVTMIVPPVGITPASAAATPSIALASQTPWVGRGDDFVLRLNMADGAGDDLEVAVTVHQPVATRFDFERTLTSKPRGSAVAVLATPLVELPPDAGGARVVRVGVQDPSLPRDRERVLLRGAGVYPVSVELRETGGGKVSDRFTTHLVNVPDPVDGPRLQVAWIVPIAAPVALRPDGTTSLAARPAVHLGTVATALDQRPDVPVTMLPVGETLVALANSTREADRAALAALARVRDRAQVLAAPFTRIAPASFRDGLEAEASAQRTRGYEVVAGLLGGRPDSSVAVLENGVDEETLTRLRDQQTERIVVEERDLRPIPLRITLTQTFELRGRQGRRLTAAAADPNLVRHFDDELPPALAAHNLLADLAVIYFDNPGRTRGVVALPPRDWRTTATFLSTVLDGLRSSPVVTPATLDDLFAGVTATAPGSRSPLVRQLAGGEAPRALPGASLRAARRRLIDFSAIVDPGAPLIDALGDRLLVAESASLRASERDDYVRAVGEAVNTELSGIRVPATRSITLTARRGRIPITVLSEVGYPVHVLVRVDSDKLLFPDGSTALVNPTRRQTTVRFAVRAQTSGAFPIRVSLESPDGRLVVGTGRLTVRSTAASGVGVILSVGAMGFLVIWWARHFVQNRRRVAGAIVTTYVSEP